MALGKGGLFQTCYPDVLKINNAQEHGTQTERIAVENNPSKKKRRGYYLRLNTDMTENFRAREWRAAKQCQDRIINSICWQKQTHNKQQTSHQIASETSTSPDDPPTPCTTYLVYSNIERVLANQ